ncbi:MAG: copper chaperone PCu(A)C [Pseudomonadota bacterium]
MKKFFSNILILTLLILSACTSQDEGPITIENAWIREAPPGSTAMAGYMKISNVSPNDLILASATSPEFNAIEFHRSVEKDGVWRMIRKENLPVDSNSSVELKPGDFHLMLFTPKRQLKDGDEVDINLKFTDGIDVDVIVPVVRPQH